MFRILVAFLLALGCASAFAQNPKLIILSRVATSPVMGVANGGFGPMGKEQNLGGWIVLNGARFRNADYPELAKILAENYASRGYVSSDPEFTQLPAEAFEAKPSGEIIKGFAICPSVEKCGGLPGTVMPFNLDSSL